MAAVTSTIHAVASAPAASLVVGAREHCGLLMWKRRRDCSGDAGRLYCDVVCGVVWCGVVVSWCDLCCCDLSDEKTL